MTSVLDNLDQDHEILDIVYDSFVHVINYKTVNIIRHKLNLNYGHNVGLKRETDRQTDIEEDCQMRLDLDGEARVEDL